MNEAGVWAFKLGDLGPTGNIRQPNLVLDPSKETRILTSRRKEIIHS